MEQQSPQKPFQWKARSDVWKGIGIYHLTFVLRQRRPLLATLILNEADPQAPITRLGRAVLTGMEKTQQMRPDIQFLAKCVMPDHVHVVIYVKEDSGGSIKLLARGMRQGWHKLDQALDFEPPYIRTLVHRGQLNAMYDYLRNNPRRAVIKQLHPDLFRIRRNLTVKRHEQTLSFSALGNLFLLDYPQRTQVQCSRSLNDEQIQTQCHKALWAAQHGCVTYSGAISRGEQLIMRALREAHWPVIIVLKDGFPPAGSPHEHYFKPGGVYYQACAEGRLLLLEPTEATAESPAIVALTEASLRAKADAKHFSYTPLPRTSARWQMIRNNVLIDWLTRG